MRPRVLMLAACSLGGCTLFVDTGDLSESPPPPATTLEADASTGDAAEPRVDADPGPSPTPQQDASPDGATAPPPVLVGDWPFDDGAGTAIKDVSGRGHDGAAVGGSWTADHTGEAASAFSLSAPSEFVSVLAHPDFDRPAGSTLTISAWMITPEAPSHDMFVSVSYGSSDQSFGIEVRDSTHVCYFDGKEHAAEATVPDIVGAWHHYAIVVDGAQARVYFDGVRVGDGQADDTPRKSTQVLFGRSNWGDRLKGTIDKVRFQRKALTDAEVLAEMNR